MMVVVSCPINSYGHMETEPWFKVSSERLVKNEMELTTPDFQGEMLYQYTMEASRFCHDTAHT